MSEDKEPPKVKKPLKENRDDASHSIHPEGIASTMKVGEPIVSTSKQETITGNISQTKKGFAQSAKGNVVKKDQGESIDEKEKTHKVVKDFDIEVNLEKKSNQPLTANAINDAASLKDEIGFEPYVNALSKMIVHKETQTPLVIGLYGPWGSGKTSFMKQVDVKVQAASNSKAASEKTKNVNRSIFFEAWQYQNTRNLSGALLINILSELESKNFWRSVIFRIKNAFRQFNIVSAIWNLALITVTGLCIYFLKDSDNWRYLAGLPLVGLFLNKEFNEVVRGLKVPMGIDISKLLKTNNDSLQATALHEFKPELKRVIDSFVPIGGRLILYIDDLDRCTPPQVVSILETLSVLFESDKCIFLLGIDKPKVIRAIEAHYKLIAEETNNALMGGEKRYGEAFLEKIIQLAIVVPALNSKSILAYSNCLLNESNFATQTMDNITQKKEGEASESADIDIEYDSDTVQALKEAVLFVSPSTPRSIKRFLNKFRFVFLLWDGNRNIFPDVQSKLLPLWLLLNERFSDEINILKKQFDDEVLDFTSLNDEKLFPRIKKFINMDKAHIIKDYRESFLSMETDKFGQYLKLVQCLNEQRLKEKDSNLNNKSS